MNANGGGQVPAIADSAFVRLGLVRPVAVGVLFVTALVLGLVALLGIPLELIPSGFSPPFLSVQVTYPGATARDIEDRIIRPLEQSLATTSGLEEMNSESEVGSGSVMLLFEGDTDMAVAYREVRDRVARVRPELPADLKRIDLLKHSASAIPIAFYGVSWDENQRDANRVVEEALVRPIQRVDGVASARIWGEQPRSLLVELDRARARAAGIDVSALVAKLARSNFRLASGTAVEGGGELLLRASASYLSIAEIESLVVGAKDVRLRDVASVRYGLPEVERYDRYNGRPSFVLMVQKEAQANTVEVCDRVKAAVATARTKPALAQFFVEEVFVQGDTIRDSLAQVVTSGVQGGLIAIVVLLFFLGRLALTVVIALSIPFSLFLAIPVMYFGGQSLNIVSLVGLMICVGLVVDNSVVVAENVERYRERGLARRAAALHGAAEVALAMTLATTTTMMVFLPAALLSSGPVQFFMIRMVTPVCVSLLASLIAALVLVPMAIVGLGGASDAARSEGAFGRRWRALGDRLRRGTSQLYAWTVGRLAVGYLRLLRASLRRRADVALVCLLALGSIAVPMQGVRYSPGTSLGGGSVRFHYSMPSDTTLEEANAFFEGVEAVLAQEKERLGIEGQYLGFEASFGQLQVFLDETRRDGSLAERREAVVAAVPPTPPGWSRETEVDRSDGAGDEAFLVTIFGRDHDALQRARIDLEALLVRIPGVDGVDHRGRDLRVRDELAVALDPALGERFGVTARGVAEVVESALRGTVLPRFTAWEREVDMKVRLRPEDRRSTSDLLALTVRSRSGTEVPLSSIVRTRTERSEAALGRSAGQSAVGIRLNLDRSKREEAAARVQAVLGGYRLPEGVTFDAGREAREAAKDLGDFVGGLALGALFIFFLMGFLFESFVLPLSVLPSIPLSFVGVWWALYAAGENVDALAGIGIMLLLGVVVNNGIVLVDFIHRARLRGVDRETAVLEAGRARFRPILMTALTTIGGLLPLAFGEPVGEGLAYGPFGKALVGGLVTSTALTLVVVPVAYVVLDDLRLGASEWVGRLRRGW